MRESGFFEKLLDLSAGIPSHDTFGDILNRINPVELSSVLASWAEALSTYAERHLTIDGKRCDALGTRALVESHYMY